MEIRTSGYCCSIYNKVKGRFDAIGARIDKEDDLKEIREAYGRPSDFTLTYSSISECHGFSFKEAYDLASANDVDHFMKSDVLSDEISGTASEFINSISMDVNEREGLGLDFGVTPSFGLASWYDVMDVFYWEHFLSSDETTHLVEMYLK